MERSPRQQVSNRRGTFGSQTRLCIEDRNFQHTSRVFSVHHIYKTRSEAKAAVAAIAIKQGSWSSSSTPMDKRPSQIIRELEANAEENLNRR